MFEAHQRYDRKPRANAGGGLTLGYSLLEFVSNFEFRLSNFRTFELTD